MALKVISAGFGRTGTLSLKLALEQLGLGPCHHMKEVIDNLDRQLPLWEAAMDGPPDWSAIFAGYPSAVDWPTAAFWRELQDAYPDAKFILSSRSTESWWASFSQTILPSLVNWQQAPAHLHRWIHMVRRAVIERSLGGAIDEAGCLSAFRAHEAAVKEALPVGRLLVHSAKDGWEPLCGFLGVPVPETPYPRTNSTEEFHELMRQAAEGGPQ